MSTSDNRISHNEIRNRFAKKALFYTLITMFCALFAGVYEAFSYGVFSFYMLFAFAFPLVFGVLPNLLLALIPRTIIPGKTSKSLWDCGTAILTVGCLMHGVLEIYGTASALLPVYWIAGFAFLAAGTLGTLLCRRPA